MGVFLAEPITKALNEALTARAALSELRRVLEIIVPLAYRPPIKVDKQDHELELYDVLTTGVQRAPPFTAGMISSRMYLCCRCITCKQMPAMAVRAVVLPLSLQSSAQAKNDLMLSLATIADTLETHSWLSRHTHVMQYVHKSLSTTAISARV